MLSNELILEYFDKRVLYFSDLVEFSKISTNQQYPLRLVIDSDSCMSRLTGGCYPDWQSGGQWKHLNLFYSDLKAACGQQSLEIVIFFNGAQENLETWKRKQVDTRKKAYRIFNSEGSPRMSNWIEPIFSKQSIMYEIKKELFNDLNARNMFCYATLDDHKKDIVHYLIENKCDGLLTNDFELITLIHAHKASQENLSQVKFYSAEKFKLSARKDISSHSFDFITVIDLFKLNPQKMILLSILFNLGQSNYNALKKNLKNVSKFELEDNNLIAIENIVNYVQNLKEPLDIDGVIIDIFDFSIEMIKKLKENIMNKIEWFNSLNLCHKQTWARTKSDLKNNEYFRMICQRLSNVNNSNHSIDTESESDYIGQNDFEFKLQQLHVNCIISPVLLRLFKERQIFLPVLLEKENIDFPKIDDIYKEIRINCYRVLFSGIEGVQVREIFLSADGKKIQENIIDVEPFFRRKSIDTIWTSGGKTRKLLWYNCIGSSYEQGSREVFRTSFDMFMPCMVLQILVKKKLLNELDIRAFLYTFDKLNLNKKKMFDKNRNLRATNLASVFLRGIEMLDLLNNVTGNPFKNRYFELKNFFDGNVFQMTYEKLYSDDSDMSYKSDCFNVSEMYKFVTKYNLGNILPSSKNTQNTQNANPEATKTKINFVGRGRPISKINHEKEERDVNKCCQNLYKSDSELEKEFEEQYNQARHSSPNCKYLPSEIFGETREKITLEYLLLNNN